jgi:hypothetical protein
VRQFCGFDYDVVIGYLCTIAIIGSSFHRTNTSASEYFLWGETNVMVASRHLDHCC